MCFLGRVAPETNTVGTDGLRRFILLERKKNPTTTKKTTLQEGERQKNKGENEINKEKLVMVGFSLFLNFSPSSL